MVKKLGNKKKGEYAELFFASEALLRNFVVAFPNGDSAKYDFILEKNGRFNRIQVKSASRKAVTCGSGKSSSVKYSKNDIDFIAAVDLNSGNIFLIPVDKIKSKAVSLNVKGPYSKYLGAWELLCKK